MLRFGSVEAPEGAELGASREGELPKRLDFKKEKVLLKLFSF